MKQEQINQVYERRKNIIDKANQKQFYLIENRQKLPAKLSGCKLEFCVIYSGNIKAEINWRLAEMIAQGELNEVH